MTPTSSDSGVRRLRRQVGALRRRLWLEGAVALALRALVVGLGLSLMAAATAWGTRMTVDPLYYAGALAGAVGLALLLSVVRYPSETQAARAADRRLGLRETLGTAVELAQRDELPPLARRQIAVATDTADWADLHWRSAPRPGRDLGLAAALGLLTVGVLLLTGYEARLAAPIPRPSIAALLPRPDSPVGPVEPAAAEEPPPPPPRSPAAADERGSPLARSVEDLRRARESGAITPQQAADRLGQAEAELDRQAEASRAEREALDRLGRALDQISAGRPSAESIERGDYNRAGEEIARLGAESDQLSAQAKAQLAQAVRSASAETPSTGDLAARERQAADALAGRDYEAARRAMQDLGQDVARRGAEVVPQQELTRAREQLAQERRAQGQPERPATAQGQDRTDQGRQSGQAARADAAQASGGAGSGVGDQQGAADESGEGGAGDGGEASGRPNGPPPDGQSVGEFEPSGEARRLETQGRRVEVDVKPSQQAGRRPGDADEGDGQEPSDEVGSVSAASDAAPRRITSTAPAESNFVPTDRRQVVRDYFSGEAGGRR